MKYPEAIKYLYSFLNYEVKTDYSYPQDLNLRRMFFLMKLLGDPHQKFPFVLVAGTKGKGSTACLLASILRRGGFETGLYTSPHLHDVRERIMISGRKISKRDFAGLLGRIQKKLSANSLPTKLGRVTFFELLTTAAFVYFASRKIDIAVLEVGLGGRLDATNIVSPAVSVITPISYDHQDKLGGTLEKIALEKAHIVKENGFLVSAGQPPKVRAIFKAWAKRKKAKTSFLGEDFTIRNRAMTERGSGFDFFSKDGALPDLFVSLPGRFQLENTACAIQAARILDSHFGFKLDRRAYRLGLRRAFWPGRLQIVSKDPWVILDGAHNGASFKALRESLLDLFPGRRMTLIFGILKDKDCRRILNELKLFDFKRLIVTQAKNPRAFPADELFEKTKEQIPAAEFAPEIKTALQSAFGGRHPKDFFVITGSFFLVAEAQTLFSVTQELAEVR